MKLYYSPGACSLASHIVMCELGMTYSLDKVNMADKTCSTGTYLAVNANGYVPALQTEKNGVLTEGVAIMQYLADQKPEANLIPKFGTFERYQMIQTLNFIATEIHRNYSPLWAAKRISANEAVQTSVTDFYKANIANRLDYINQILAKNDFIFGSSFTVADAYLFTVLNWNKMVGIDTSKWSSIDAYMTKIFKRPSVQKAMKEEGILN